MMEDLLKNPHVLSEEEIEEFANYQIKKLSEISEMTYDDAYKFLKSCQQIYAEAVKHLGHNAVIEMSKEQVKFVLDEYDY